MSTTVRRVVVAVRLAFVTACAPMVICTAPSAAREVSATRGPEFRVKFDRAVRDKAATGRLVVYLVKENSPIDRSGQPPSAGPFFESPQPMFGVDVVDLAPGVEIRVDDNATGFPGRLSELPTGRYKAQCVLDMNRLDSQWKREPGNLYSDTVMVDVTAGRSQTFTLELTEAIAPPRDAAMRGVQYVEVRSELLTRFRGYPVTLKAGVVMPVGKDGSAVSGRKYPAVYEVPGFGGDHTSSRDIAASRRGSRSTLLSECAWIVLNPEGPNGHHLFANSDNNGPVGDALVRELIPALEKQFPLIAQPSARLLRGHSSGGWSSVWLAITYPEVFGAAWSSSPDPVDFTHFQLPNIYADANMFTAAPANTEIPSYRDEDGVGMTIRQENQMEEVLGPSNTSGQQWDSWLAAFGPRTRDGTPASLYDSGTGVLDHAVAGHYKRYDIADMLRQDPSRYAPIFKQRIRLLCGAQDNYFLNEAVASLQQLLTDSAKVSLSDGEHGYIKLVPSKDHSSIFATPEMGRIPAEMLEHLKRSGHVSK